MAKYTVTFSFDSNERDEERILEDGANYFPSSLEVIEQVTEQKNEHYDDTGYHDDMKYDQQHDSSFEEDCELMFG